MLMVMSHARVFLSSRHPGMFNFERRGLPMYAVGAVVAASAAASAADVSPAAQSVRYFNQTFVVMEAVRGITCAAHTAAWTQLR
jgi:hypothetical protein